MMEEDLRQLLKEHGEWNLYKGKRGKGIYLYAIKWKKDQVYLGPEAKLPELTREQVLEKLSKAG